VRAAVEDEDCGGGDAVDGEGEADVQHHRGPELEGRQAACCCCYVAMSSARKNPAPLKGSPVELRVAPPSTY
jgi:hypothetical protein